MEIRHLRYFLAVADAASFSRAAEQLGMATSPLSRRIRDLEKDLGTSLFARDYRNVALTEAGATLVPHARDVVARFDALPSLVPRAAPVTPVTIGTAPEVSPQLRARFIGLLRAHRPALTVRHRPASTAPLLRAVLNGTVDVGFVHGLVRETRLHVEPVESQPLRVVVATGSGFDGRESVRLAELAHLPYTFLHALTAPMIAYAADAMLAEHGVAGRLPVHSTHADLVPMVSAGQAFTICGALWGATRKAFLDEPVLMLPFEDDRIRLVTNAVRRRDADPHRLGELIAVLRRDAPGPVAGPRPEN